MGKTRRRGGGFLRSLCFPAAKSSFLRVRRSVSYTTLFCAFFFLFVARSQ